MSMSGTGGPEKANGAVRGLKIDFRGISSVRHFLEIVNPDFFL